MSVTGLKNKDDCNGDREHCTNESCPVFGRVLATGKVKGCQDPDARRGLNRVNGLKKQAKAKKQLGIPDSKYRGRDGNEENWADVLFANEVKSGAQVSPIATWFLRVETQALTAQISIGSARRPVRAVAMPDGMSDGIVAVRTSTWARIVKPALDAYYGPAA